jgi:hypothetical protein
LTTTAVVNATVGTDQKLKILSGTDKKPNTFGSAGRFYTVSYLARLRKQHQQQLTGATFAQSAMECVALSISVGNSTRHGASGTSRNRSMRR